MKKIFYPLIVLSAAMLFVSCDDWLREDAPGKTKLKDFFTSGQTAIQAANAAYVPMAWEYNNTYYPEWFIGDVASDDAVKGGQNLTDMAVVYDIENFKTVASNELLLDYYRAQYQGVQRCNFAIENIGSLDVDETMTAELQKRLIGEVKFLRAFYYFRLVRVFGGVPLVDNTITSSNDWIQPRATAEQVYEFILTELAEAEELLWKKSDYPAEELGRVTKGAAQAMLLKVNLYLKEYDEARKWGKLLYGQLNSEYSLCPNYMTNFLFSGENSPESVFEIQYAEEPTSDYGQGNGFTRGTFTVIMTRPRSSIVCGAGNSGWGFNKPTQDLYDEYEAGDPRREATIMTPTDAQIQNANEEIYLGSRYVSRKYLEEAEDGSFVALAHATRAALNRKEIRYADVLLMYAEACIESNKDLTDAKDALNLVRGRVGLGEVEATRENLRHERRVELGMEGHRWFDLCRWGIAGATMNAYKAKYSATNANGNIEGSEMADFVVGKHELFPIPAEEARMGKLEQNPQY